jgi:hypothetical protein
MRQNKNGIPFIPLPRIMASIAHYPQLKNKIIKTQNIDNTLTNT